MLKTGGAEARVIARHEGRVVQFGAKIPGPCVGDQLVPVPLDLRDGVLHAPAEIDEF